MTDDNKKTKKAREKGIAEHDNRNDIPLTSEKTQNAPQQNRENKTDSEDSRDQVDTAGGSLSGNAAGNRKTGGTSKEKP